MAGGTARLHVKLASGKNENGDNRDHE